MTFTVGTITRCSPPAGTGSHYHVPLTIGGQVYTLETTAQEVQAVGPSSFAEAREAILARLKSAILEADAGTFAQIKTALEGNSYEV